MKYISLLSFFFLSVLFFSCSDDNESVNNSRLQIALTDAPGDYEALTLDVEGVEIKYGDDDTWKSEGELYIGEYDVLKLTNGTDQLLLDAMLPATKIHQIRLILGEDNYLTVNGVRQQIKVPSGETSGLKLNVQQDIQDGLAYKIVLDFDVAKSVVERGGPEPYILKPVIRTYLDTYGGSIAGSVDISVSNAVVYAISGADTVSTYPNENGEFLFAGLAEGSYTITVSTPISDISVQNVLVVKGEVNAIGLVGL